MVKESDIVQVMEVSNEDRNVALALLELNKNNAQDAINYFFSNGIDAKVKKLLPEPAKEDLWSKYCEGKTWMDIEGITKFYEDCLVDPTGPVPAIICCIMNPKADEIWSWQEFENLLKAIGTYDLHGLTKKFEDLKSKWLNNDEYIKELWNFLYERLRNTAGQGRCPNKDVYVYYMQILLRKYHYRNELAEFMSSQVKRDRIFPELWEETLTFLKDIRQDFSNFQEEDSWPTEIADFVEWKKTGTLPEDDGW